MNFKSLLNHLNRRDTRIIPEISSKSKTFIITFIVFLTIFFTKNILAVDNIIKYTQDAQKKSNNSESWQLNSWNTTAINTLTTLTGEIPFKEDGTMDIQKYRVSGLLGTTNNMIASLYSPQSSGIQYVAQVKDNFLGKQTYAQGVAFRQTESLQPLLPIWKALRNVVYVLSSIVFIIIGLMIMLRVKISPQAVVTIQTAIPGLITALILVTFSYAIAGLVIDLSYWVQSLVIALIFSAKGVSLSSGLFDSNWKNFIPIDLVPGHNAFFYNFAGLANADFVKASMLANATVPLGSLIMLSAVVGQVVVGSILGGATGLLGSAMGAGGNVVGGILGGIVGAIGGVIFMIVLFILVAIWLIKLFFGLIKAYVTIIIKIVTGPLEIGLGAIPQSKVNFSTWFIDLLSQVAVFPIVMIALVFVNYLIEISCGLWTPSLLNAGAVSAIANGLGCGSSILGAAIGLAGLAMISKLPGLVPAAIFQLKPSPFGTAIGEAFKDPMAKGIGKWGANRIGSDLEENSYNHNPDGSRGRRKTNLRSRITGAIGEAAQFATRR
ncbi:MAG: hypothetical protein WCG91_03565 [Candidatus Shapirobacteria bacterium]